MGMVLSLLRGGRGVCRRLRCSWIRCGGMVFLYMICLLEEEFARVGFLIGDWSVDDFLSVYLFCYSGDRSIMVHWVRRWRVSDASVLLD